MIANRLEKPIKLRPDLSENAASILNGLLTPNPNNRLGAGSTEEIKEHPFFKGIDWSALSMKRVKPP
jgi:serine/threonine protein kinase